MNNLKYYRKKAGYTLEQLGELADIAKSYVYEIENDQKLPGLSIAYRISDIFDVSVYDIFPNPSDLKRKAS